MNRVVNRVVIRVVAALALLAAVAPSHAAGAVDCVVTGRAKYRPALALLPADTAHRETLALDCTGDPADTGAWTFVVTASGSDENCVIGDAYGTVSGDGPDGPLDGIVQVNRRATGVAYAGNFVAGGHLHQFALDLAWQPHGGQGCLDGVAIGDLSGTGFLGPI